MIFILILITNVKFFVLWLYLISKTCEDQFPFMRKISTILAVFLNKNEINDTLLRTPNSLSTIKLKGGKKKAPRKKKIIKETKYNEFEGKHSTT